MSTSLKRDPALRTLTKLIQEFASVSGEANVSAYEVFMYVATNPGVTLKDISRALNMQSSTASRNVFLLSRDKGKGVAGLDLVVNETDPMDRRRRTITLTPKGKALVSRLAKILED